MNKFNISYQTTSYVRVGETIKLNAKYENEQISWSSSDENCATVNEGFVTGLNKGNVLIKAFLKNDPSVYVEFYITVLNKQESDPLEFILKNHESNVFKRYNLGIGAGHVGYYKDIIGSVSKILFNEKLEFDYTFYDKSQERYGDDLEKRVMDSIEFITVHYTGNMRDGANAWANASWFAKPLEENPTSIHYCTGNDGIFKGLEEKYMGAHAGDYSSVEKVGKFEWRKTGIKVLENDPKFPKVTINEIGNFSINGIDTGIQVPLEEKYGRGIVTENKWLNNMGIAVNIIDKEYYLGTAWWCYTQVGEGRICSTGGNHRSIGIESCVNEGSDLWYTWQKTAMLVADLMVRHNLDITKVLGHHAFSAKNCPQPMLENDMEIWWKFIELVEAEYEKINKFNKYDFKFETNNVFLNNKGCVIKDGYGHEIVTYKVTIKNENDEESVILSSII